MSEVPIIKEDEMERSAWLLLARGPLREMAERRPLLLLLQLDAPRMLRPMKRACNGDIDRV